MLPIRVRSAVATDLDAAQRIFRAASLSNSGDRRILLDNPDSLVFSPDVLAAERSRVAVGPDGVVLGFATAVPTAGGLELDDLFVDPVWMRNGVGRRLVEDVKERARAEGIGRVGVTANPHAMAFYLSVGFVPDGATQTRFGAAPASRGRFAAGLDSFVRARFRGTVVAAASIVPRNSDPTRLDRGGPKHRPRLA
jgi:GNAT superfamily N-acetyltransferase